MIEFAFGLCLGAVLGVIGAVAFAVKEDRDEYRDYLDGLRKAQLPHDWEKDGSDL